MKIFITKNSARRFYPLIGMTLVVAALVLSNLVAHSQSGAGEETREQWIALGKRVHGGFGSFIALGIRIGLDARKRLKAAPRELDVTYYDGASTPCACVADGIMISTVSTPGQNSLRVAATKSPRGSFGLVIIKNKKTGARLRYLIPSSAQKILDKANAKTERERYDVIMDAPRKTLFKVSALK